MFFLYWRQLSLCLIAVLSLTVKGSSTLLAQSVPASHVAGRDIAAEKQVIQEASADTFLLAGDTSSSNAQAETAQPAAGSSTTTDGNFFERLTEFYRQDWNGSPQPTTAALRRALSSPLDSPPF
ncbi:MAG: hypothetical protein QOJ42_970, partial [Acidobacteriaceae bacterium]|nr:hypothetical protein [Acidobacteriaceae bacterium]